MQNKNPSLILLSILSIAFFQCSRPVDKLENKSWHGKIIRTDDNKTLSEIKLKIARDTMFVFSNAIFGSENDTLLINGFTKKDSVFTLKNLKGDKAWSLKMTLDFQEPMGIILTGADFYIVAVMSNTDTFSKGELAFYRNMRVPSLAYQYLYGAYEGTLDIDDPMLSTMTMFMVGPMKFKLVFYDGFKVKVIGSAFLGLYGDKQVYTYQIEGDEVVINTKKKSRLKMTDNGYTLSAITDETEMVLHKKF